MHIEPGDILSAIVIGLGATAAMDLWNKLLKRTTGIPSLDYCLLGRWIRHMPEGTFRHSSIAAAAPMRFECATGWAAHYSIGAGFAIAFVAIVSGEWLANPTLLPAMSYGVATVIFPFFIMQPSLGLGIASSRSPKPAQARLKSLATHSVFGLGLYACALALSALRTHV